MINRFGVKLMGLKDLIVAKWKHSKIDIILQVIFQFIRELFQIEKKFYVCERDYTNHENAYKVSIFKD